MQRHACIHTCSARANTNCENVCLFRHFYDVPLSLVFGCASEHVDDFSLSPAVWDADDGDWRRRVQALSPTTTPFL